jgi:cellulose synthase/poly-beta-1,6-N-acetylglucosamine synthase-like glycosyltransferase
MEPVVIAHIMFWGALFILFWAFAGYPALMILLARAQGRAATIEANMPIAELPQVSVVVAGYNEANRLTARIENLFDTDYPADKLEVVIVSDGSNDDTEAVVTNLKHPQVRLIMERERRGKSACVGIGVEAAKGEIMVLCDARQRFDRQTIPALVARFSDDAIGAVSGELEIAAGGGGIASGVGAYWKLERKLRLAEGILDSTIGCTGSVYAVRKTLFRPIPGDTLLDDVVIPMQILCTGARVVFEPRAKAFDPQELKSEHEEGRKQRTLAGNIQMLVRYPSWLFPWRNRCVVQLISHKYLRLAGPFCLIVSLLSNLLLLPHPIYQVTGACQVGAYALAAWGKSDRAPKPARLAATFLFLNYQVLRGIRYYFFGDWRNGWR